MCDTFMANATEDNKEEKTSAGASQEEKQSDQQKADDQAGQADVQNDDQGDDKIDYAAELAAKQRELEQAQHTIIDLRRKKEQPIVQKEESVDEDTVDQKINDGLSKIQQQLASTAIASTLATLSDDPDERKLIMFHYQNSIKQSGITPEAILSDLENAKTLANRRKLLRENAEIKRAVATKKTINNSSQGSNQDKPEVEIANAPKLSEAEVALLARRGLKPTDVKVLSSTVTKR